MLNRYPTEEIVPALTHHNGRVRRYAAMMLDIGGEEQLVNFLVDLLQSESAPARWAAARALEVSIRPLPDPGRKARSCCRGPAGGGEPDGGVPEPGCPGAGPRRRRVAGVLGPGVAAGAAPHVP